MFPKLLDFFLCEPRRLVTLGSTLYRSGFFLIIVGLIGRIAAVGTATIASFGGRHAAERSLADLYPTLPTWWVPESAFGFTVGATLALLGLVIATNGRRWQRLLS